MIENVLANLIASAIGAVVIYLAGKLVADRFFLEFGLEEKPQSGQAAPSGKTKPKRRFKLKVIRKLSWRQAYNKAKEAVDEMHDYFIPTLIVGIGRGGAIYGSIISYMMGEKPMLALDRLYDRDKNDNRQVKRFPVDIPISWLSDVLLVAGEYHTGETMKQYKEWLENLGAGNVRTCVFYNQVGYPGQIGQPDIAGISKKHDCLLPWQEKNYLRTWKSKKDAQQRESGLKGLNPGGFENSFFIMRHAVTDANARDEFIGSGSPDADINFEGRIEAENVGRYLKNTIGKLDVIYCSPLKRCRNTAEVIRKMVGGTIIPDDNLIEADFGGWEGVPRASLPKAEYEQYEKDQYYQIPGSSDSYYSIKKRAESFLAFVSDNGVLRDKKVLVVTHKTIGRIMVQTIEGKGNVHFRSIPMENASLRKILVTDKGMRVAYYIKVLDEA